MGGLNIANPSGFADEQFLASQQVTKPLVDLILSDDHSYPFEVLAEQIDAKSNIKSRRRQQGLDAASVVRESLTQPMQLAMDLAQEKGASSWLTALPLEEHGFALHKSAFRDAMALRYSLDPLPHSIALCLWPTLLGAACSLLSERRVSFDQAYVEAKEEWQFEGANGLKTLMALSKAPPHKPLATISKRVPSCVFTMAAPKVSVVIGCSVGNPVAGFLQQRGS